jgi:stearoyl-CoA desaturase (delta-9 desaturase)
MRNRFHVLALYGRNVVLPVLRQELRTALPAYRRLLRDAKPLLIREDIQLDEAATHTLDRALGLSQALHTVYRFKEDLKQLWANSSISYEARIQSLREWCQRAKDTGIQALEDFADLLHGYTIANRLSVSYVPTV